LEVQRQQNQRIVDKYNELVEELEGERLETSLQGGEVNFWQGHCEFLRQRCNELEDTLEITPQSIVSSSTDEDASMWSTTDNSGRNDWPETSLNANADVGELFQEMLIPPLEEGDPDSDDSFSTRYGIPVIPRLAAVHDDANIPCE
jgi:hypothetical protein